MFFVLNINSFTRPDSWRKRIDCLCFRQLTDGGNQRKSICGLGMIQDIHKGKKLSMKLAEYDRCF
jgi:hypothetical protein